MPRAPDAGRRAGPGGRAGSAYPGMIGIVGGGWKNRLPRPMAVPCDGGASPTTVVVPTVTSASGLSPRPTPTTPPVAPWPAEIDTAASGAGPGDCSGAGGEP